MTILQNLRSRTHAIQKGKEMSICLDHHNLVCEFQIYTTSLFRCIPRFGNDQKAEPWNLVHIDQVNGELRP